MRKKYKFGIIGAGFMSSAIIKGVLRSKTLCPEDIIVSDININSLDKLLSLGVSTTTDNKFLADNSEFVLFAIKPQNLDDVLEKIKECSCHKFISIMAGVKISKIKNNFFNVKVARCMPNTPCSISSGAVGLDLSDYTDSNDIEFIESIFNSFATVCFVEEKDINVVTGVSGSSPAYFYLFLQGIIDAGVKLGLDKNVAKKLATSTMIGAGKMILENEDKSIDELINAVCSKGGTTIEAVNTYKNCKLSDITEKAVIACVKRSIELENL